MTFHYIFTGDKDNNDDLLHSGSHYFPFEFTLPPKLPSSFKGKHGRLRYYVRLTICTPGGPNHERTSKFAVISSLDLNKEPDALVRYTMSPYILNAPVVASSTGILSLLEYTTTIWASSRENLSVGFR